MVIIFGWEKRVEAVRVCFENYCYNCQKSTDWIHGIESEWVTFFDVGVLRFKKIDFLLCDNCNDDFNLDKKATQKLKELEYTKRKDYKEWVVSGFGHLIESKQLANKTEMQLKFIRSTKKFALEKKPEE